jgi:hypothetical protein
MARTFPEEAVLHCRSGLTALRGNLPDQARGSLLRALALNPMIWEAFEGLCTLGKSARRILRPACFANCPLCLARIRTRNRGIVSFTAAANQTDFSR